MIIPGESRHASRGLGLGVEHVELPDSSLLLQASSGRVLGLFACVDTTNFYWTNPDLSMAAAQVTIPLSPWKNWGGDRTWISPEMPFFFPRFPDMSVYEIPAGIDPGDYHLELDCHRIHMAGTCRFSLPTNHSTLEVHIEKTWSAALNPLQDYVWSRRLRYAGYTQHTVLRRSLPGAALSLWNIVQLPFGGVVTIVTKPGAAAIPYFVATMPTGVSRAESVVQYKSGEAGILKFGLEARFVTGRMGYVWNEDQAWQLVVRECFIEPSGIYLDAPWASDGSITGPACALQCCSVNSEIGRYVEIEYHSPALSSLEMKDVSRIWAFRGEENDIRAAAELLLRCTSGKREGLE